MVNKKQQDVTPINSGSSGDRVVVKSNKVIEASYQLSISEQRILLTCISKIDSRSDLSSNTEFIVTASEISDLLGSPNTGGTYRDIKAATERLYRRSVTIDDPDPDNPKIKQRKTRWISSIDYMPGEGRLKLTFALGILPYLSLLSKNFTKYKLQHVAKFNIIHSLPLYELLVQWSSTGEREIEIEWLKEKLKLSGKYSRTIDFKKRVLEPSIKEINKHSNLWVEYGDRRTGRSITHFQFKFGVKGSQEKGVSHQPKPPSPFKKITKSVIESSARPGESYEQVEARLRQERN